MRQIHPVGFHEKFVASGVYACYEDGQLSGVVEYWSIHELPDKSQFVRADLDGRASDWFSLLVEILYRPDGKLERFDAHLYDLPEPTKIASATYTVFDDKIAVSRTIADEPRRQEEEVLPEGFVIKPPVLIAEGGPALVVASENGKDVPVFSVKLVVGQDDLLQGYMHYRSGAIGGLQEIIVGSQTFTSRLLKITSGYESETSRYSDETYWIDAHGVLLRYVNDLSGSSAVLTQYARRPEPPRNP